MLSGDPSATRPKGSLPLGNGVPGHELPPVRAATLELRTGDVLVLATDGVDAVLRRLARHLRLDPGDQRAHPGRPLEADGRRPRGGGPLPGRAAMNAGAGRPGRFAPPTRPLCSTTCWNRARPPCASRTSSRARRSAAAQRARPGRRPPAGADVGARRRLGRRGGAGASPARPVTSSSRASPRSRWSSVDSRRPGEAALLERRQTEVVAPAVDLPRGRLAGPRRLGIARGDVAAGGRAGARARGSRLLRGHRGGRGRPRTAEGASYPEDERRWTAFIRWLDLLAIYRVVRRERRIGEGRRRAARATAVRSAPRTAPGRFEDGSPHR